MTSKEPALKYGNLEYRIYDFNNDGWEDLYVAGRPLPGRGVQYNVLLLNNRDGYLP